MDKATNYISAINKFWEFHDQKSFTTTEISVFFYLLNINNKLYWVETFERNNKKVLADLNITYPTLSNARKILKKRGILDFLTSNGSAVCSYTFKIFLKVCNEVANEVANEVNNTNTNTNTINKKNSKKIDMCKLNFVNPKITDLFHVLLSQKKWKAKSIEAINLSINKINKYSTCELDTEMIIENTIEKNYQGIFPIDNKLINKNNTDEIMPAQAY